MSNESHENVVEKNTQTNSTIDKLIVVFLFILILISIVMIGLGYFRLNQSVELMQANLSMTQRSIDEVQQTIEKNNQTAQESQQQEQKITELYARLVTLDGLVDQLPLIISEAPLKTEPANNTIDQPEKNSAWKNALNHSWQALSKIVVVRYIGQDQVPLITPDEKLFLYQNLHAQIQSAMWAVQHHNTSIYQSSLERTKNWVERYFVQDAPETKNILQEISDLQNQVITVS